MTRARTDQLLRPAGVLLSLVVVSLSTWTVHSQHGNAGRRQRFAHNGIVDDEGPIGGDAQRSTATAAASTTPTEAPTGFDNRTNGFSPQEPPFDTIDEDNVVPLRSFNDNRFIFEEAETIPDGLGPTYNAQGCRECHQNVVTGGASQIAEHRTGRLTDGQFFESLGGSLVHSRATHTSSGRDVGPYDRVADPEDDGVDVVAFANFMRATKAPSRGPIDAEVVAGERLFARVACAACHIAQITTARAGTAINGGRLIVPPALGNKVIHPYSDFLMHDIGTGDGVPVLPTPEYATTAAQIRTAPLWALRTRNRLMHDGLSFSKQEAIARHAGQATEVRQRYDALTAAQKAAVLRFLDSL